jgi:ATP-dependent RNA helicase DDX46/PRP5
MTTEESAAERKRKRLEAWRKRQQESQASSAPTPAVKVSLSLGFSAAKKLKKKEPTRKPVIPPPANPFGDVDDDENDDGDDDDSIDRGRKGKLSIGLGFDLLDKGDQQQTSASTTANGTSETTQEPARKRQRKGRWDAAPTPTKESQVQVGNSTTSNDKDESQVGDALDSFMDKLQSGALGSVTTQVSTDGAELLTVDVGGSMMRVPKLAKQSAPPVSGGVITSEQIAKLTVNVSAPKQELSANKQANPDAFYTHSDWESDNPSTAGGGGSASEPETEDDEEEEKARRAFIEALKSAPGPEDAGREEEDEIKKPSLAAEVKTEKDRREKMLRDLERQAEEARALAQQSAAPDLGRLYNDAEGGVMDEAERNLEAAMAAPDALQVLAELNKKKELKSVDHSKIEYIPFKKNLYIVPRSLANLTNDEILDLRAKLKVRVRGHGAPAPVTSFEQCGLSERIMKVMEKQNIRKPFPVQAQCIPCIMAGRDTIGVAKTGSGKTLAFLLPLLRHIMAQPPLAPNESGPIGLILAPARELAYQIHLVCKTFAKSLGLK